MNNELKQHKNWKWSFDTKTDLYTAKHDDTDEIVTNEDYFTFIKTLDLLD